MVYSFLLSSCSFVPNHQLKAIAILLICVPDIFGFVFYDMKRNSQIYKRPITNYYSMPLSKIIWISPIISYLRHSKTMKMVIILPQIRIDYFSSLSWRMDRSISEALSFYTVEWIAILMHVLLNKSKHASSGTMRMLMLRGLSDVLFFNKQ